jgi:hypothetical protein
MLAKFLHCKVIPPSPFHPNTILLFGNKSPSDDEYLAHTQGLERSEFCLLGKEIVYINYLEAFCMGDLSLLFHLFIGSVIYLY